MSEGLHKKAKTALDETRLLILGAQVLLGFQFQLIFQDRFSELPDRSKYISLCALVLMILSLTLLIAPSMQHQLVEAGDSSSRLLRSATLFAGAALLPFAISLGLAAYIVIARTLGALAGMLPDLLLVQDGTPLGALGLLGFGAAVMLIGDHFAQPTLVGGAARLPFLLVLVGVLGGIGRSDCLAFFSGP